MGTPETRALSPLPPSPGRPGSSLTHPVPFPLLELPAEIQHHVLRAVSTRGLISLAATGHQMLLAIETALRLRAAAGGHWLPAPPVPTCLPLPDLVSDDSSSSLELPPSPAHGQASPVFFAPHAPRRYVTTLLHLELRRDETRQTLAAGAMHSLFVAADGALLSCGVEKIVGIDGSTVAMLSGLLGHGLLADPIAGLRLPTPLPSMAGVRVRSVAANGRHSMAVAWDGSVYTWGCGEAGKLGHGDEEPQLEPRRVVALDGSRVRCVAAGYGHSLCLTDDGGVYAWGCGAHGQCGHGGFGNELLPRLVAALSGRHAAVLAAGGGHTLVATEDGDAFSFGRADRGALGLGDGCMADQPLPRRIEGLAGVCVTGLAAGDGHSLALSTDGRVHAWGVTAFGRLGLSSGEPLADGSCPLTPSRAVVPDPTHVAALRGVCAVAAGFAHSMAQTRQGEVYAWGCGASGRLGHGGDATLEEPKLVEALLGHSLGGGRGEAVCGIAAGEAHSLAAKVDGRAFGWGGRLVGLGVMVGAPAAVVRSCLWLPKEYPAWLRVGATTHWQ